MNQRITDPVPDFPNVSISRIEQDLNTEYEGLQGGYDTAKNFRIQSWKEYSFQPYGNEIKGSSGVVDSTIFNAIEWMLPTLIKPFVETQDLVQLTPTGSEPESAVAAGVFRELLNYQIKKRSNLYELLYDTLKTMLIGGIAYKKVTWQPRNPEINEPVGRPVMKHINPDGIRWDWTCNSFYDSHVVTHDEEWTKSDIREFMTGVKGVIKDRLDKALESKGSGLKDNKLRDESLERPGYVGEQTQVISDAMAMLNRREHWTKYDIRGDGVARPIMAVFIEDCLVQVIENPYDFKRPPFAAAECLRDPVGNPATGWASALSEIQKFRTGILRMVSDNMNAQQNGMYEVDRTYVDDITMQLIRHAPQGSRTPIPTRKIGSVSPIHPAPLANHAMTAWEMLAVEGENRSGNTRYSQGLDSKSLNQTATGIVSITQKSEMRMWELATRFAETAFKPMVRMVMALDQQKLEKQDLQIQFGVELSGDAEMIQQATEAGVKTRFEVGEWVTLSKDDIGGFFTLDVDISVGSDSQTKISNMMNFMQYVGPYIGKGVPQEVILSLVGALAKEMRIPFVEAFLRGQNVGSRGVSVPKALFGGGEQGDQASTGPSPEGQGVAGAQGEQGLPITGV